MTRYGIAEAGDLDKATAFHGIELEAGLQELTNLMPGGRNGADDIVVRQGVEQVLIGQRAGRKILPKVPAVDHRDVRPAGSAKRIGYEISQVGFLITDQTLSVSVIGQQAERALPDNPVQQAVRQGLDAVQCRLHLLAAVGDILQPKGFVGEFSVGMDDEFPDVVEFAAALHQQNGFSVGIIKGVAGNQVVIVSVQHDIDAISGFYHRPAVDRSIFAGTVAQM